MSSLQSKEVYSSVEQREECDACSEKKIVYVVRYLWSGKRKVSKLFCSLSLGCRATMSYICVKGTFGKPGHAIKNLHSCKNKSAHLQDDGKVTNVFFSIVLANEVLLWPPFDSRLQKSIGLILFSLCPPG